MYRVFSPKKLTALRGERPRKQIIQKTEGILSEQDLYCYEKGVHKPSDKKVLALLQAYECSWDDISESVEAVSA